MWTSPFGRVRSQRETFTQIQHEKWRPGGAGLGPYSAAGVLQFRRPLHDSAKIGPTAVAQSLRLSHSRLAAVARQVEGWGTRPGRPRVPPNWVPRSRGEGGRQPLRGSSRHMLVSSQTAATHTALRRLAIYRCGHNSCGWTFMLPYRNPYRIRTGSIYGSI